MIRQRFWEIKQQKSKLIKMKLINNFLKRVWIYLPVLHFSNVKLSPLNERADEGEDIEDKVNGPSEVDGK